MTGILIPLYEGVTHLDFTGPHQFLSRVPGAEVVVASLGGEPIVSHGLKFADLADLEKIEGCDVLCIPGGLGCIPAIENERFLSAIRRIAGKARYVTSVCTGSLILGAAGLLHGRRAACHWAWRDMLTAFGATPDDGRVVRDGNVITGGGVTAGVDFALLLIAELWGTDAAQSVQLWLEYAPAPPFDAGRPESAPTHIRNRFLEQMGNVLDDARRRVSLLSQQQPMHPTTSSTHRFRPCVSPSHRTEYCERRSSDHETARQDGVDHRWHHGIGLATAKLFVREGARISVNGRNASRFDAVRAELGDEALIVAADVRSPTDMETVSRCIGETFGGLDILFANAGIAYATPLATTDEARYDEIMDVNVKGLYFTLKTMHPHLREGASIILTTSFIIHVGRPDLSLLSASKAAVRSLARTWSRELLDRNIRVNALSPGGIDPPLHLRGGRSPEQAQAVKDQIAAQVPLGRLGRADEIAAAALFLASDDSRYVLGAELVVDGGISQI